MSTILLVEDDHDLADGLLFTFREEGFQAVCAATAKDALAAFGRPFDIAVMDVILPDGSGYELCRELRRASDVPVIFLTSCDDEVNIVMGLDGGADDYVTKPFRLKELMSRIKAQLRRRCGTAPAGLRAGNVILDESSCRAYANGSELPLTATEYRLLSLLVRHCGQTLTRNQLLALVWDSGGSFVDDNTLSVHTRHLREKLDAAGSAVRIHTVRGIGYRLEVDE